MQAYREYLLRFLVDFGYPDEAHEALSAALERLLAEPEALCVIEGMLAAYAADRNTDFSALVARVDELAARSGIHRYTACLLILILLTKESMAHYRAEGLGEAQWHANFTDLKYKAVECKLIKGVWGTFSFVWFSRFYNVTRHTFGPLQFETTELRRRYEKNGISLPTHTKVINVHIPRTGERLSPDKSEAAFRAASAFFKERHGLSPTVFVCDSWLLFPRNLELLKPDSNLYAFISRFDIIEAGEYENYNSVWRLFDADYNGDPDALPQDTSLRRAYVALMKRGEKTGWGYGAFLYE